MAEAHQVVTLVPLGESPEFIANYLATAAVEASAAPAPADLVSIARAAIRLVEATRVSA